jgi:hypothetical protein
VGERVVKEEGSRCLVKANKEQSRMQVARTGVRSMLLAAHTWSCCR